MCRVKINALSLVAITLKCDALLDLSSVSPFGGMGVLSRPAAATRARLSPLARGRIIGMREAGEAREVVADKVRKTDGSMPDLQAIVVACCS